MSATATPHPYRDFELAGWECAANAYAETFESATSLYAEVLLDADGLKSGNDHLGVACGTGFINALALERGAQSMGVDFSTAMLAEAARLHPSVRFERAAAEARRVLRKGGRIAFTVWATPDQHALHAIALDAVHSAGSTGASLPAPPHGVLNTLDGCMNLLKEADFKPIAEQCSLVQRTLHLSSVAALTRLIESGTVRLASLLRSQPKPKRLAILSGLETAAARYQREGRLEIPVVAVLAVGAAE